MSDVDVLKAGLSFRNRTEDTLNENIRVKTHIHSSLSLVWMI